MTKNYCIPEINQRFNKLFCSSGLSQKEFGEMLGISQRQVSAICMGQRKINPMLLEIMKLKLNLREQWLLKGEPPMYRKNPEIENPDLPVLADIPAGDWKYWIDSYTTKSADTWISAPGINGENLFAIRVEGDSMEPRFHEGDILVIDPHRKFDGGIAVVRHGEGYKIRNVRRLAKDRFLLIPINEAYEIEEIVPKEDTRFYVPVKVISVRSI